LVLKSSTWNYDQRSSGTLIIVP